MVKMKSTYRQIISGLSLLLLSSCGIESYRTFGPENGKTEVCSDQFVDCNFSQVIYDNSSDANIYLDFKAKTKDEIEITNVSGHLKWFEKGKEINCPQVLTSIAVRLFQKEKNVADSTFLPNQLIPGRFKTISGTENSLLYELEFSDTTYKFVPTTVDKMAVNLVIRTKATSTGKLYEHRKTIKLNANKHHYFWFLRDG
ncbi:hypothetical protein [Pontibacter virosus]|uniref:Lipoprotein n=1 Tax=Pontibacter virosus TaxID=1765052 RepID=A0A2U1AI45_9BACT|nr:hypothetical protein [Pontibacter virosus]PVY36077.1 hypothetical protein C8E01_1282 [Pontibacter virosus]